jgi:hypothetical protein
LHFEAFSSLVEGYLYGDSQASWLDQGKLRNKMKRILLVWLIFSLLTGLPAFGSDKKLPIIDGKTAVASVNGEPITLEEFNRAIGAAHAARSEVKVAGRIDYSNMVNRLINTRLILLEARNMGIQDLPAVKDMVDSYSKESLMSLLVEDHLKDIRANQVEVEAVYKESVKEWKISSVSFEKEEEAKKVAREMQGNKSFDEIVRKAVEDGIAKGRDQGFLKNKDLKPGVTSLVVEMEVGSVSPVVPVGKDTFVIFKLEEVRYPEKLDPKAWEKAEAQVLKRKRVKAARDYFEELKKRYVTMNEQLLETLDYQAEKPGFEKLLQDTRVIAEIKGGEPITVGDLSRALERKFYHGVEVAIKNKRINKAKKEVMEDILERRLLLDEALRKGFRDTEIYKNRVREYENSVVFDKFVKMVIIPDIKLKVAELRDYYEKNADEYTSPAMIRIKSLVFHRKSEAVNALDKLVKGTDFTWLSYNAAGQVDQSSEGLLDFAGKLLTVSSLPEGVRKAVSEAKPGDFRLYASPEKYYYVLYIYQVIPARLQPFEDVKQEIAKEVFNYKVKQAVELYADKLKEYYPVKIYAKDLQ